MLILQFPLAIPVTSKGKFFLNCTALIVLVLFEMAFVITSERGLGRCILSRYICFF